MSDAKLRKRKNRNWEYLAEDGRWKSTGMTTFIEAKMWLKTNSKICISDNVASFARYIINSREDDSFYATCKMTNRYIHEEWWNTSENRVERYIVPAFKSKTLDSVTPIDVQKWYMNLNSLSTGKLAGNSKNKILALFSIIMDQAVFYGYINDNPCKKITKIRARDNHRTPFSDDELKRLFPENRMKLISIYGNLMWACYFLIARDTGWRPGEIAGLTVEGLYLDRHGIYTEQSIDSFSKKVQDSVKTSFSGGYNYRVGIISEFTSRMLKEYITENNIKSGLVFRSKGKRKVITSDTSRVHFNLALERVGIEKNGRSPYALRTTFFTKKANKLDEEVLKELMGHTKWRNCYDQRSPEEIIDKISGLTR